MAATATSQIRRRDMSQCATGIGLPPDVPQESRLVRAPHDGRTAATIGRPHEGRLAVYPLSG